MNLQELKRLALAAIEQNKIWNETNQRDEPHLKMKDAYFLFNLAASPETILSLISKLETCIDVLQDIESQHGGQIGDWAREALSKIKVGE